MRKICVLTAVVFLLLAGSSLLMAQSASAYLTGADEVPPVASNAEGRLSLIIFADHIDYTLTGTGFGTNVVAAHIHLGFPGVAGPVIIPLYSPAAQGAWKGSMSGTITPSDLTAIPERGVATFEDARRAILMGRTYVNIHTTLSTGGEIRGQIHFP